MFKYIISVLLLVISFIVFIPSVFAQEFRVLTVQDVTIENDLESYILGSTEKIEGIFTQPSEPGKSYEVGQKVVVTFEANQILRIHDYYRFDTIVYVFLLLIFFAMLFSGLKGLSSFLGLFFSILVIFNFIIPNLLQGYNPIIIATIGTFLIGLISIFTSHGFNIRTSLAVISTFITLGISIFMAALVTYFANMSGAGTEDAYFLSIGRSEIDLQGVFLAGIIIGTLGVLDDITTAQTAVIEELKRANSNYTPSQLFKAGTSIGKEHIASLINTLVLAYAGTSLPLFMLYSLNSTEPLWVVLNSSMISEEVIRSLLGSITLVLSVPISTGLAVLYYKDRHVKKDAHSQGHFHVH
jgi:uncharacterized membrane protein